MDIVPIVQWHKLASLQDVNVAQTRKRNIVNRQHALDAAEDYLIKVTLGITG